MSGRGGPSWAYPGSRSRSTIPLSLRQTPKDGPYLGMLLRARAQKHLRALGERTDDEGHDT